jgi:hypothetical protein
MQTMSEPEHKSLSFIVRIWLERREIAGALPHWRGIVQHVESGRKEYFVDLDSITIFMSRYMEQWGVKPKMWILMRERFPWLSLHNLLKRNGGTK